jgi:hypothetical protein
VHADVRITAQKVVQERSYLGKTSQGKPFGLGARGNAVIGFSYPHTKLPCTGTHPTITYVEWAGIVENISFMIGTGGSFAGTVRAGAGNLVQIRGVVTARKATGTLTDTLRPVPATGITSSKPPYTPVAGGVCRATVRFAATLSR